MQKSDLKVGSEEGAEPRSRKMFEIKWNIKKRISHWPSRVWSLNSQYSGKSPTYQIIGAYVPYLQTMVSLYTLFTDPSPRSTVRTRPAWVVGIWTREPSIQDTLQEMYQVELCTGRHRVGTSSFGTVDAVTAADGFVWCEVWYSKSICRWLKTEDLIIAMMETSGCGPTVPD